MRIPRSYLYVPGNAPAKFDKALASSADAVILDLEDAVPMSGKEGARTQVRDWLLAHEHPTKELWVRVNSGDECRADLHALDGVTSLTGLVLAKAADADYVCRISTYLSESGHPDMVLSPLLETPTAILDAPRISAQPSVHRLQIGEYDFCAESGITPGDGEIELLAIRSQVVLASAAAEILPPVAPVSIEIRDTERFTRSTEAAARQGFVGRACIHPAQLDIVHTVFTPSEAAVNRAKGVLRLFDEQVASDASVLIDDSGRLLDGAVVRQAQRTLSLASASEAGKMLD